MSDQKQSWFKRHKILTVVGVIVVLGIIGGAAGGSEPSKTTNSEQTNPVSEVAQIETKQPEAKQSDVPAEYKSALNQAKSYSDTMHMSKQGVYDQLTSPYGGKFSAEAAQYGIDNVKADWNANALAKAKDYQKTMSMSPAAVRDQLTSAYGEKFTAAEADYAVANLNN